MAHLSLLARRSRLGFPLLCAVSALAGATPMLTAPHEANACSGSGSGTTREATPKIDQAGATERDLIAVRSSYVQVFGGTTSSAKAAHIETASGATVPLSRNDFSPGSTGVGLTRVLIPTTPLDANTDYTLVVEGVVSMSNTSGPAETVRLAFKTGDKLHPAPPTPALTAEKSRAVEEDLPMGSLCCGQSADYVPGGGCSGPGKGTPPRCSSTKLYAEELITFAWTPGAASNTWGAGVSFEARYVVTGPVGEKWGDGGQPLSYPPIGLEGDPFTIRVGVGGKACVKIVARDAYTGVEKSTPETCYDASPTVPAVRTSCESLIALVTTPESKAGCEKDAALLDLLKDCPGAPTNGAAGSSAGGSNAGGSNAGGSDAGGSSAGGASAGGPNAGGSSAGAPSSGGTSAGGLPAVAGSGGSAGSGAGTPTPAATPAGDGGCSLGSLARSDGAAALAPLFAALAGVWVARRRQARGWFGK